MHLFLAAMETWHDLGMEFEVPFRLYTFYHLRRGKDIGAITGDLKRTRKTNPLFRFFLDSGAYSMAVDYQARPEKAQDPQSYAKSYLRFVERHHEAFDLVAELDIEKHIKELPAEATVEWFWQLVDIVGPKALYVWHPHRGYGEWQTILANPKVQWVALANDTWQEFGLGKTMRLINEAKRAGKFVHGFGQTRIKTDLKFTKYHSIDSSSWVQTERYGGTAIFQRGTLTTLSGAGADRDQKKKTRALYTKYYQSLGLDVDKILAEDPQEVRKSTLLAWRNLAIFLYQRGMRTGTNTIWNMPPWNGQALSEDDVYEKVYEAAMKKSPNSETTPIVRLPPGAKKATVIEDAPKKRPNDLGNAKVAKPNQRIDNDLVERKTPPEKPPAKDRLAALVEEMTQGREKPAQQTNALGINTNLGAMGNMGTIPIPKKRENDSNSHIAKMAQHFAPTDIPQQEAGDEQIEAAKKLLQEKGYKVITGVDTAKGEDSTIVTTTHNGKVVGQKKIGGKKLPPGAKRATDTKEEDRETKEEIDTTQTPNDRASNLMPVQAGEPAKGQDALVAVDGSPRQEAIVTRGGAIHSAVRSLPVLACDSCSISGDCPEFKQGYECAFLPLFQGLSTREDANIVPMMEAIVDVNMQRTMIATLQERLTAGGQLDPRVSAQMQSMLNQLERVKAMKSQKTEGGSKITVEERGGRVSVQAEGPAGQKPSLLASLFGTPLQGDTLELNPEDTHGAVIDATVVESNSHE